MANLRTNYQDDILDTNVNTKRKYNMINNADGTVSFEDVSVYTQEGDSFGAVDVNQATTAINDNTNALNGVKLSYNTSDGHFYAQKGSTTKKLGSGEGTATTSQVLDGATFTSEQYEDIETGTMPNRGKWISAFTGNFNVRIPEGYHNGQGYVNCQGAYQNGMKDADARINKNSSSYTAGYSNGINAVQFINVSSTPDSSQSLGKRITFPASAKQAYITANVEFRNGNSRNPIIVSSENCTYSGGVNFDKTLYPTESHGYDVYDYKSSAYTITITDTTKSAYVIFKDSDSAGGFYII